MPPHHDSFDKCKLFFTPFYQRRRPPLGTPSLSRLVRQGGLVRTPRLVRTQSYKRRWGGETSQRTCWSFCYSQPSSPWLRYRSLFLISFFSAVHIVHHWPSGWTGGWGCRCGRRSSPALDPDGQEVVVCKSGRWRRRASLGEDGQEAPRDPSGQAWTSSSSEASGRVDDVDEWEQRASAESWEPSTIIQAWALGIYLSQELNINYGDYLFLQFFPLPNTTL